MEVEITMRKNYGIKEETIIDYIKGKILVSVFAEEGGTEGEKKKEEPKVDTPPKADEEGEETKKSTPNFNYEDLISKARKEEKDKLYPKITALEKEKETLIEKNNKSLLTIGELQSKIEELEESNKTGTLSESEEVAKLKKALEEKEEELKGIIETTEDIATVEERVRNEVAEEYEVKLYREQKLREVGDQLIPELVTGSTKEDIDKSLAVSQERFNDIVTKTISGVKIPPANTSVSKLNNKEFSIEDLAQLDPRSEEYREVRKKLGLK